MRRIVVFALSLMLLCLSLTLMIGAEESATPTVTLTNGTKTTTISAGEALPVANAVEGKVFVGWLAEATETLDAALLPAGASAPIDGHAAYTALYVSMSVRSGTELRLTEDREGLRFLTDINAAELALLQRYAEVGFGTIIAPRDYVTKAGNVLTPEALAAVGLTKYLDIPSPGAFEQTEELFTVAGSVVNIRPENRTMRFHAAGYLTVTYTNGTTARVYCSHQTKGTNRLYDHVEDAFCDLTAEQDETHTNQTEHGYSPYTEGERAFMKSVLDSVINLRYVLENPSKPSTSKLVAQVGPVSDAYQAPFTAIYDDENYSKGRFILTCDGINYNFERDFAGLILSGSVAQTSMAIIEDGGKRMIIIHDSSTGNY